MARVLPIIVVLASIISIAWSSSSPKWLGQKRKRYSVHYTAEDQKNKKEYVRLIDEGIRTVESFWGTPFKNDFDVYIHPSRSSLDTQWQNDWKMPEFKSECWMVASGIATKLDLLSPMKWSTEACEHLYSEKGKTQRLITHELFHVYHGQMNASPDFNETDNIDWFVEGLATYASGQCDTSRINEIKKIIAEKKIPGSLDKFWTGKLRYGLSGTIVMYIDHKYGRKKLYELLKFSRKNEITGALGTTEPDLLLEWEKYIKGL